MTEGIDKKTATLMFLGTTVFTVTAYVLLADILNSEHAITHILNEHTWGMRGFTAHTANWHDLVHNTDFHDLPLPEKIKELQETIAGIQAHLNEVRANDPSNTELINFLEQELRDHQEMLRSLQGGGSGYMN